MRPPTKQLTLTLGAHSTARVAVRFASPAFAAPYAAVPGDGLVPETLPMFTIEPPFSWRCMTAFALCAQKKGARRLSSTTDLKKRGDASAAGTAGEPPA